MSTKVYNAFRLREDIDLWDFIHDARKKTTDIVSERMNEVHKKVKSNRALWEPWDFHEDTTYFDFVDTIYNRYRGQLGKSERSPYNLDVSITIRRFEGRLYLMGFSDRVAVFGDVLEWMREDDRLENYEYWNNTDEPEDVTMEEWEERSRCWDEMDKNWLDYLALDLVSATFNGFFKVVGLRASDMLV
jgi:hypothetical protein